MVFRKAEIHDIETLVQLRTQQLIDEGSSPDCNINSSLKSYFQSSLSDGSLVLWIALENNTIIATGGVCFHQMPPTFSNPTGGIAYITNMYTLPFYRRRGIASQLLEKVMGEAKERGYGVIRLHASSHGKELYTKHGFIDSDGFMHLRST